MRVRGACISQAGGSRLAISPLTGQTLRTSMITSAFKHSRSE